MKPWKGITLAIQHQSSAAHFSATCSARFLQRIPFGFDKSTHLAKNVLMGKIQWGPITANDWSSGCQIRAAIVTASGGHQSTGQQRGTGRPRVKSVPWKKWMVSNSQGFSKMGLSLNFPSHGPGLSAKRDDWGSSPMT